MGSDFLRDLLGQREITFQLAVAGMAAAFAFGSMHALSPGHGKLLTAAYLAGTRGTVRHAAMLGGLVTFTHTISVLLLGLATLFLSRYILPEQIAPWLEILSGCSIIAIGLYLLRMRLAALLGWNIRSGGQSEHFHGWVRHQHRDDDTVSHNHGPLPETVTLPGLIALGVSGGLVPCPSALVLLLSAIALGRTGLGLVLVIAFSLGMAVVLTVLGVAVIYARSMLPGVSRFSENRIARLVPVFSAVVIVCVGVAITGASAGVFGSRG